MLTNFEYNRTVISRRENGFINLTSMCRANGKELSKWYRLKGTKAFIDSILTEDQKVLSDILIVQKGGQPVLQGTWAHPELAIHLAQWISPKFHRWCNAHIFNLMESGSTSLQIDPIEEMKLKIELTRLEAKKAKYENESLALRNYVATNLPKHIGDRILGVTEVKEVEYRDRTFIDEDMVNDGSTMTQAELCRHLGFVKDSKIQTSRLKKFFQESGIDKDESFWDKQSSVITHRQIKKSKLEEIEELHNKSVRQLFLSE